MDERQRIEHCLHRSITGLPEGSWAHVGASRSRRPPRELELVDETNTSNIWRLQVAWFAAFVGDSDPADRVFDRAMQSPPASRMATAPNGDLVGFAPTAGWLAREGPVPEAGRMWGAELERRCRARRPLFSP